jgi:hypothetical protein
MAISICYWADYTQGKTKLRRKSENAVACDRVMKFLFDAETDHIEAVVQASVRDTSYRVQVVFSGYISMTRVWWSFASLWYEIM